MSDTKKTWRDLPIAWLKIPVPTRKFLTGKARKPDGEPLLTVGDVHFCLQEAHDIGLGELQERVLGQIEDEIGKEDGLQPKEPPIVLLAPINSEISEPLDGSTHPIPEDTPPDPAEPGTDLFGEQLPAAEPANGNGNGDKDTDAVRERKCKLALTALGLAFDRVSYAKRGVMYLIAALEITATNSELRTWILTETELARWFREASFHVGRTGCEIEEAMLELAPGHGADET